jgi:hypothetical protein
VPAVSCCGDWPLPPLRLRECLALQSIDWVSSLSCHGPWDWGQWSSPHRGFGHGAIDALPDPLQPLEVVMDRQSHCAQLRTPTGLDSLREVIVGRVRSVCDLRLSFPRKPGAPQKPPQPLP